MKSRVVKALLIITTFFLVFAFLVPENGGASVVKKANFQEVIQNSELIFEGRVVSKETSLSPASGYPITYFSFEIIEVIKGSYSSNIIKLGFMGGTKGELILTVSDMLMPQREERGIYFVESLSRQQVHPLYGWSQGHYLIKLDPQQGPDRVVPVHADPSAIIVAPTVEQFKESIRNMAGGN